jgi:formylmethanofuran dehydrogenase subunit A
LTHQEITKLFAEPFTEPAYTIKSGEIVAINGEIVRVLDGRTYWIKFSQMDDPTWAPGDLKRKFREYWTVEFENYFIPERFLKVSAPVYIRSEV